MRNEYWISEYVITKNDSAVRGIYISKERLNPDKLEHFLAIYSYSRREDKKIGFPKRSQRRGMWRKLWKGETRVIHVESFVNPLKLSTMNFGIIGRSVFGFEVRALRRRLKPEEKILFDRFYYEK